MGLLDCWGDNAFFGTADVEQLTLHAGTLILSAGSHVNVDGDPLIEHGGKLQASGIMSSGGQVMVAGSLAVDIGSQVSSPSATVQGTASVAGTWQVPGTLAIGSTGAISIPQGGTVDAGLAVRRWRALGPRWTGAKAADAREHHVGR